MAVTLNLLCAGAVQGLARALLPQFERETGATVAAQFGAVGALRETLLGGAPCDVLIVTDAMIAALEAAAELQPHTRAPLGRVRTGVAVPSGAPLPDIGTPEALRASLRAARAIYLPDPLRSTAGIHFTAVLARLRIDAELAPRLRSHPNGAAAMRALAADAEPGALGCTQITEILDTPGLALVGALPSAFELATVYSAAVAARATQPALAQHLIALLAGPATRALRGDCGFEFD